MDAREFGKNLNLKKAFAGFDGQSENCPPQVANMNSNASSLRVRHFAQVTDMKVCNASYAYFICCSIHQQLKNCKFCEVVLVLYTRCHFDIDTATALEISTKYKIPMKITDMCSN